MVSAALSHSKRIKKMKTLSLSRSKVTNGDSNSAGETVPLRTPDARPQRVVGQLPPPALLQHHAAVHAAAHNVHGEGDDRDHAEDAARAERLFGDFDAAAGGRRARFEEIGAFVRVGADEVEGELRRHGVAVAEHGDDGALPAGGGARMFGLVVLVFLVVVLFVLALLLIILVIVVVDNLPLTKQTNTPPALPLTTTTRRTPV